MPVKVADRDDTGCADANLTGSLLIFNNNYKLIELINQLILPLILFNDYD